METKSFEEKQMEMESPIMRQYFDLKKKHPDALLLFRCGDFYECYKEDAEKVARTLGITLTYRNNDRTIGMAGFPYHTLDTYLPKLIRAGYRCAICDQLEDPKLKKKIETRSITELVKPSNGFKDEDGAMRHTIIRKELDTLYRKFDKFIADSTRQETEEHKAAILEIKGWLHKRIQDEVHTNI